MRRSALRRRSPITRKRSERGDTYHQEYMAAALLVKRRSGGWCEIKDVHNCAGRSTDFPHHRKLRSQGGSNSLANLLDVCVTGHYWIHRQLPREHAEAMHLLVPRETPEYPYP